MLVHCSNLIICTFDVILKAFKLEKEFEEGRKLMVLQNIGLHIQLRSEDLVHIDQTIFVSSLRDCIVHLPSIIISL